MSCVANVASQPMMLFNVRGSSTIHLLLTVLYQVNEVQLVVCQATAGDFNIIFSGYTSLSISFNANEDAVKAALEAIPSIPEVNIIFSQPGSTACETSVLQVCTSSCLCCFFIQDGVDVTGGGLLLDCRVV